MKLDCSVSYADHYLKIISFKVFYRDMGTLQYLSLLGHSLLWYSSQICSYIYNMGTLQYLFLQDHSLLICYSSCTCGYVYIMITLQYLY